MRDLLSLVLALSCATARGGKASSGSPSAGAAPTQVSAFSLCIWGAMRDWAPCNESDAYLLSRSPGNDDWVRGQTCRGWDRVTRACHVRHKRRLRRSALWKRESRPASLCRLGHLQLPVLGACATQPPCTYLYHAAAPLRTAIVHHPIANDHAGNPPCVLRSLHCVIGF